MNISAVTYRDKLNACFVGKNIGGTMGAPYEGVRSTLDVQGFSTKAGEVLPNDDLDLQLVWLYAVDRLGINRIDTVTLGEMWQSYIIPYWNEYGVAKNNLSAGLPSPLSGAVRNSWKHSNGAWIRTEVWATLLPGEPELAAHYAVEDALVDHADGEGTVAAAFVAAMQSAAFVSDSLSDVIDVGLSKIPENSRTAKSIRLVRELYAAGKSAMEVREAVFRENADIGDGWFEAPSNVAYAVLGLLFGEGDFKKSMITAINCGDDTDCTAATVGATLGILGGMAAIPEDWRAHIGDDIVTVAIDRTCGMKLWLPATCTALAERIASLAPTCLSVLGADTAITDATACAARAKEDAAPADLVGMRAPTAVRDRLSKLAPYSFRLELPLATAEVVYHTSPTVKANEEITVTLRLCNRIRVFGNRPYRFVLRWLLPEGFAVLDAPAVLLLPDGTAHAPEEAEMTVRLRAGETILPNNRVTLELAAEGRSLPMYIPIPLLG